MSAAMGQDGGVIRGLNSTSASSRHAAGISTAVGHARQAVQERAQGAGASCLYIGINVLRLYVPYIKGIVHQF